MGDSQGLYMQLPTQLYTQPRQLLLAYWHHSVGTLAELAKAL